MTVKWLKNLAVCALSDGQYIWIEISELEVIEIINYHKEK